MSGRKKLILRALHNVQEEEARQGPPSPQTMILRALNIAPNDRSAADQAFTLGGELVRITEHTLGPECWEWAIVSGKRVKPHAGDGRLTPGNPPQGTVLVMLLAMRLGREVGRLESAPSEPEQRTT